MNEDDDQFTGIFDDLTPDDFITAPMAARTVVGFSQFVDANVDAIKKSYIASDGQINIITVLVAGREERILPANDDENLGSYVHRMREEAKAMKADRLFICRRAPVASKTTEADDARPVDDPEWLAENQSILTDGVIYYAEQLDPGRDSRIARIGIMRSEDGRLVERTEIDARLQPIELFANMLG